jgi:hypothetical protein
MSQAEYETLFRYGVATFGDTLEDDKGDFTAFSQHGGKLIVVHGLADHLVGSKNVIDYYEHIVSANGGLEKTRAFMRLFLVPGGGHVAGGTGPYPDYPSLNQVMRWVEEGEAPSTILAKQYGPSGVVTRTRPICMYPEIQTYKGQGSTDEAASFICAP